MAGFERFRLAVGLKRNLSVVYLYSGEEQLTPTLRKKKRWLISKAVRGPARSFSLLSLAPEITVSSLVGKRGATAHAYKVGLAVKSSIWM